MEDNKKAPRAKDAVPKTDSKVTPPLTKKETVFQYFSKHIGTVRMCAQATGISSQTICSYKASLINDKKIIELYKAPCQVTGRNAWYYSPSAVATNPQKAML